MQRKSTLIWSGAALLGLASATAGAGTCPLDPSSDGGKVFISTPGTCWDYGQTNVSGDNGVQYKDTSAGGDWDTLKERSDDANEDGIADSYVPPNQNSINDAGAFLQLPNNMGLDLIGNLPNIQDTGGDGTNGYLTIDTTLSTQTLVKGTWSVATGIAGDFFLLLKSGQGLDPVWAVFRIAAGQTSGDWEISCTTGPGCGLGLSHSSLYGQVPLPAAGWLLLSGMLGLMGIGRRRRAS